MKFKPKFYAPILHQFIVSLPWADLPTGHQEKDKIKLHDIFQKMELTRLQVFRFPKMTNKLLHSLTRLAKMVQVSA
jgi:hypothetical protein